MNTTIGGTERIGARMWSKIFKRSQQYQLCLKTLFGAEVYY